MYTDIDVIHMTNWKLIPSIKFDKYLLWVDGKGHTHSSCVFVVPMLCWPRKWAAYVVHIYDEYTELYPPAQKREGGAGAVVYNSDSRFALGWRCQQSLQHFARPSRPKLAAPRVVHQNETVHVPTSSHFVCRENTVNIKPLCTLCNRGWPYISNLHTAGLWICGQKSPNIAAPKDIKFQSYTQNFERSIPFASENKIAKFWNVYWRKTFRQKRATPSLTRCHSPETCHLDISKTCRVVDDKMIRHFHLVGLKSGDQDEIKGGGGGPMDMNFEGDPNGLEIYGCQI